jgi:hypothetical protein
MQTVSQHKHTHEHGCLNVQIFRCVTQHLEMAAPHLPVQPAALLLQVVNKLWQRIATADKELFMLALQYALMKQRCSIAVDVSSTNPVGLSVLLLYQLPLLLLSVRAAAAADPALLGPPAHPYCSL